MEFKVKDEPTFKALAANILEVLIENADTILDDNRHFIVLENGSGIKVSLTTDSYISIFPAIRLESGSWYTSDTIGLGAFVSVDTLRKTSTDSMRALDARLIRIIAMRAWRAVA